MIPRVPITLQIPNRDKLSDKDGLVGRTWLDFFRYLKTLLDPMGVERAVPLLNNQAIAVEIPELSFNKGQVTGIVIEMIGRRITSSAGTSKVSSAVFFAIYNPASDAWSLNTVSAFAGDFGVTVSITSAGVMRYTSNNIAGSDVLSDLVFRARSLAGKTSFFSTGA